MNITHKFRGHQEQNSSLYIDNFSNVSGVAKLSVIHAWSTS